MSKSPVMEGELNTPLSEMNTTSRPKLDEKIEDTNNKTNKLQLMSI